MRPDIQRSRSEQDVAEYTVQRRDGGIRYTDPAGKETLTLPSRTRSAESDLNLLFSMLRWATTVRTGVGTHWLAEHPLNGVRRPIEKNPRRPIATFDRFVTTIDKMKQLAERAEKLVERARWVKMEMALVLAEATGRRLGSIRQLCWEDIDFEKGTIRWRAEAEKKGCEYVIPTPIPLAERLKHFRSELGGVDGWLFAGERKPDQPMDRHLFDTEREAKLPKLAGGIWHSYRRKWATERKHLSIRDVAAAGGWKDTETLLTCYQHPDQETLLAEMNEPRKLRDTAV